MYMTVSVNAISKHDENNIIASCMKLDICYIMRIDCMK